MSNPPSKPKAPSKKKSSAKTKLKTKAPFPTNEQILEYIRENPSRAGKREIARAFKLDTQQKMTLKKVLREMTLAGDIDKGHGHKVHAKGTLPPVGVIEITGTDLDGEILARPLNWEGELEPPKIYLGPARDRHPAPGPGDRVLARLSLAEDGAYEANTIRTIGRAAGRTPGQILGIFDIVDGKNRLRPTDRRARGEFVVESRDALDAKPGDLVRAEPLSERRLGLRPAKIVEIIGKGEDAATPSLIAITDNDLPVSFSAEAEKQAEDAGPASPKGRDDIRNLPLVTIDGEDARDFDDAVWAEPDTDKKNPGGWRLLVAIADVAWYVRPGDALDRGAYERGNSVYFPDRVVPMLPEALSNGWCSLVADEDRPCVAAHLWIDASGNLIRHEFKRALMRSKARLTYEQAQAAQDGSPDETTKPLVESVIAPLYGAYEALLRGREMRGVLELDMPERKVVLDKDGKVSSIASRQRLDSHKLIEEFMIAANVAAAETLEKRMLPCMYRVHDQPSAEKLESLRAVLDSIGLSFSRGGVASPSRFNQVLKQAASTPHGPMVNVMVLRTQSQAEYGPDNLGHFGLALNRYCHFTSPIRRYADLLVHRALIGDAPGKDKGKDFREIGEHLSMTERRAAGAERDAVDRYTAAYLADRVGALFPGRINGVTRFGLFVTLDETGADGLVPIRTLADDFYIHDEARHSLVGRRNGIAYQLGQQVEVRLAEANPITGGMIFDIMDGGSDISGRTAQAPGHKPRKSHKPPKKGKAKHGKSKAARRLKRKR
ncbi:MAG: ribonuclease R [Rhodospirillales bacterium]|nr:ribonuclease R [Rhodospirillales bacterium]